MFLVSRSQQSRAYDWCKFFKIVEITPRMKKNMPVSIFAQGRTLVRQGIFKVQSSMLSWLSSTLLLDKKETYHSTNFFLWVTLWERIFAPTVKSRNKAWLTSAGVTEVNPTVSPLVILLRFEVFSVKGSIWHA